MSVVLRWGRSEAVALPIEISLDSRLPAAVRKSHFGLPFRPCPRRLHLFSASTTHHGSPAYRRDRLSRPRGQDPRALTRHLDVHLRHLHRPLVLHLPRLLGRVDLAPL